jgi:hypothetical protein
MTETGTRTRRRRTPGLLLHKPTGQARVILNGKTIYLGLFGSPEAHERYAKLIRKWEAGERRPLDPAPLAGSTKLTVSDLIAAYLTFPERTGRYMKHGKETTQRGSIRVALDELERSMGRLEVRKVTEAMSATEHHLTDVCRNVHHNCQLPLSMDDLAGGWLERSRRFLVDLAAFSRSQTRLPEYEGFSRLLGVFRSSHHS